jgi:excinuclease ABC subunit C
MPAKDQYRKFKISKDQNDDFASMREVITRRYARHCEAQAIHDPESLPNLIIIDGGKGQLAVACEVLRELGLDHIRTVGLAKKEEEIFFPDQAKPLILDRRSPELFLLQRIRNEAHRFAITYHRKLRSKRSTKSELDSIPGLGPSKKKALLQHFGSVNKIKEANLEELLKIKGISPKIAKNIAKKLA